MSFRKLTANFLHRFTCAVFAMVFLVLRPSPMGNGCGVVAASSQMKLIQDMLESYDRKAKPTWDNNQAVNVTFSMDLYQILELNEPQQYILLNAWIIERWHDEFLYWNPLDYGNITELRLPYDVIWMPDTTLYNSLVMKDDDTRRLLNAKLTTNATRKAVLIDLLYPAIFKFSCLLSLRYFPYDLQVCTMTFSSWTYDQKGIDYLPYSDTIGISNFLENEGWYLLQTSVRRKEVKYSCCPNKYTLLKLTLYLRRKPLFYLINLIIPTSIITLIAIVGFFTTSSASGMREEKVSLGITTLLSMSILMLMVSDQMPTTSTFIPLIGWFILCTIILISMGTLASTVVIAVQKRGRLGERLSPHAIRLTRFFACVSFTELPLHIRTPKAAAPASNKDGEMDSMKNKYSVKTQNGTTTHRNSSCKVTEKAAPSNCSRLLSRLTSAFRVGRSRSRASNRLGPDKSTDLLVAHAHPQQQQQQHHQQRPSRGNNNAEDERLRASIALSGGTVVIDASDEEMHAPNNFLPQFFNNDCNNKILQSARGATNAQTFATSPPYSAPDSSAPRAPHDAGDGISALIAANLFASSAVAAPSAQNKAPYVQRLSLRGIFDDEENDSDVDDMLSTGVTSPAAINQFAATVFEASGNTAPAAAILSPRFGTPGLSARREQIAQHARLVNENVRQNRLLAQKEYEWVATVLERCFFIVFVIIFFFLTIGINLIGYLHWSDIDSALKREGDERHI